MLAPNTGGKSRSSLGPRKPLCLGSDQPSHQEQDGEKSDYEPRTPAGSVVCGIEVCGVSDGPSLRNPSQHRWIRSCAAIWVHPYSGLWLIPQLLSIFHSAWNFRHLPPLSCLFSLRARATLYSLWNAAPCLALGWCPVNVWNERGWMGLAKGVPCPWPCSISEVF